MSKNIRKVLIANRGEIALRIQRTLKEMGIKSVAIFSEADKDSLHASMADEGICIGPKNVADSYLNKIQIINAAILTGADAIHPGFGFLSENPSFAKLCEIYDIKFIGPTSKVMSLMGNKGESKKIMRDAGIPVVPGSDDLIEDVDEAKNIAKDIGYPIIIKANLGGGGKGMRVVYSEDELEMSILSAKKEAENSFDDGGVFIEKFIESPKHIEVQILADEYGNIIHLGARDCSTQLNHQKVVEEAPPQFIDDDVLKKIYKYSVDAAKFVGYTNAGTMEFLVSENNEIYFMEMNTRIQVEHPITEMITGIDIVKEQVNIASNKKLSIKQEEVDFRGHAIECRINAYDSENNFMPSCGKIETLNLPGGFGVRVDSSIYQGCEILPFYDSMLAKIISFGRNRDEAIKIMKRALDEVLIEGVKTNTEFNKKIIDDEVFKGGRYTTSYLEDKLQIKSR